MTVAQIVRFDSRADCKLRAPTSRSNNIDASRGGVLFHYVGGDPLRLFDASHESCRSVWRGIQSYHMDKRGLADVAYSFAICPHGIVLAGRGFGVRTGANGTNIANYTYYAVVLLAGGDEKPNQKMKDAMAWAVTEARRVGAAGDDIGGHRDVRSTACPGDEIYAVIPEVEDALTRKVGVHRDAATVAVRRPDTVIAAMVGARHAIAFLIPNGAGSWTQTYPNGNQVVVDSVDYVLAYGYRAHEIVKDVGDGVAISGGTAEQTGIAALAHLTSDPVDRKRPFATAA